jgi:hypothetical protein
MQCTRLPNGIAVWYDPHNAETLILEYSGGEQIPAGRREHRRLAQLTIQLREVYEKLLLRMSDEDFCEAVPVDAMLKLDEIVTSLGPYAVRRAVARADAN